MKQRVFINTATGRVEGYVHADDKTVELQKIPTDCKYVDLTDFQSVNNDWVYVNNAFMYNPIVPVKSYAVLRKEAYPDPSNQLDAIFKMALALKDQGFNLPADTVAWIEACKSVKDKYPKGSSQ